MCTYRWLLGKKHISSVKLVRRVCCREQIYIFINHIVQLNEVAWLNNVQNTQLFSLNGSLFITPWANWDGSAPKLKYFFQLSFLHVGIFLCEKDSLSARGRLEKQSNCTVHCIHWKPFVITCRKKHDKIKKHWYGSESQKQTLLDKDVATSVILY